MFDQIQCYFTVNKLTTDFQHAYREGHSTSKALTQMTDDWLREIDDKKIGGAVLLDFSAAFAGGKSCVFWIFTPCYIVDKELPV